MSAAKDGQTRSVRGHQRGGGPTRGLVPKPLIAFAIVCAAGLLLIPYMKHKGRIASSRDTVPAVAAAPGYVPGLSLAESALDPQTRSYKGLVRNDSARSFNEVAIYYDARDQTGELLEVMVAKVGHVGPHQSVKFETGVAPKSATGFGLREISGSPQ